MFRNLYLTNQLMVETTATSRNSRVVIFIVKVRLVEKKPKSHVGRVYVTNVMSQ